MSSCPGLCRAPRPARPQTTVHLTKEEPELDCRERHKGSGAASQRGWRDTSHNTSVHAPISAPCSSGPGGRNRGRELGTASNAHACIVDPGPGPYVPHTPATPVPLSQMWHGPVTQAVGLSGQKMQWRGWPRCLWPPTPQGSRSPSSGRASGPSQLTALAVRTSSCGVSTPLPSTAPEALWLLFSGVVITNSYKQACTKLENFLNTIKYLSFSKWSWDKRVAVGVVGTVQGDLYCYLYQN